MHDFNWNYVLTAIVINLLIVYIVPRLIKKPTGFKVLDDIVLYLNSQKGFMLSSSLVLVAVIYGSHYWLQDKDVVSGTDRLPDF